MSPLIRRAFILQLSLLIVVWSVQGLTAQAQAPRPAQAQDFVLIEMLLSLQGAVIGGGAGVYLAGQALGWASPCDEAVLDGDIERLSSEEAVRACELSRSILALMIGSGIGIPLGATFLGVELAGLLLGVRGNTPGALAGSLLGELLGAALWRAAPGDSDLSLLVNPITLAALGATLGFNWGATLEPAAAGAGAGAGAGSAPEALHQVQVQLQIPLFAWAFAF